MKKLLTALVASFPSLTLAIGGAAAQAPPPVPALPDAARQTGYDIGAGTGPYAVGFDIYGDGDDYCNWLDVWLNEIKLACVTDWTLSLVSGTLSTAARPLTNARITLTAPRTGNLFIDGQRRPRRTAQFPENRGVSARDLNQLNNDIVAMLREQWDFRKRLIVAPDGNVMNLLPTVADRRSKVVGFDQNGLVQMYDPVATGPIGPAGPVGPQGPPGSGAFVAQAAYTVLANNTNGTALTGGVPISGPDATALIPRIFYARNEGFNCAGSEVDNTPAWNAFMAKVVAGTYPSYATLMFSARGVTDHHSGDSGNLCAFHSRPATIAGGLKIDGVPWFSRNYQPGALRYVTGTASCGVNCTRITVDSTTGIFSGTVGIFNVGGTTEANGLWSSSLIDATHFSIFTTFVNAYAPLTITGVSNNGSGKIRVTVASGAASLVNTPVFISGVGGTGGLPAAINKGWPAVTPIDATHFDIMDSVFVGAFTAGGSPTVAMGGVLTAPLEPFIEMGPAISTDGACDGVTVNNLLIYSGTNHISPGVNTSGQYGGIGFDIGSYDDGVGGLSCINARVNDLAVTQGAANAPWGIDFQINGNNYYPYTDGVSIFRTINGDRSPRIRNVISSGNALFYGMRFQSIQLAEMSGLEYASNDNVPIYAALAINGRDALTKAYQNYITSPGIQGKIYIGPFATLNNLNIGSIGDRVVFDNDAGTVSNTVKTTACNPSGSGIDVTIGTSANNSVVCGNSRFYSSAVVDTIATSYTINAPVTLLPTLLRVGGAAAGYQFGVKSATSETMSLDSTSGQGPRLHYLNSGAVQVELNLRPDSSNNFFITNGGAGGVVLAPAATSWASASDRNLKRDWESMSVLDKIAAYPDVDYLGSFVWKPNNRHDVGSIAQDVYRVFPDMVLPGESSPDETIDDMDLADGRAWKIKKDMAGQYALQGVKELLRRVQALEARP